MLHATLTVAGPLNLRVAALHVHHGLSAQADDWLAHCAAVCERWSGRGHPVDFEARRMASRPAGGESVEAWARQARYAALGAMAVAHGADLVLLGHHRRDQAETFLLQALRGGGVAGLSAMPATAERLNLTWARPWLATPREAIEAYGRRHRLHWIEDDSNADERFARNRLRISVWPALTAAFPQAEASLAAAAGWAQEAAAVMAASSRVDLVQVAGAAGLDIAAWQALPPAPRSQALRAWLREQLGKAPPASLVQRLLDELAAGGSRRWPAPVGELRSYRGTLRWDAGGAAAASPPPSMLDASRPGSHELAAWQGAIEAWRVEAGGLPLDVSARLEVRARAPDDRFQSGAGRPARRLKLQFQAAGMAAWGRRQLPILCHEGRPVFVPGLGIDARAAASPGEPQMSLIWRPHVGDPSPQRLEPDAAAG